MRAAVRAAAFACITVAPAAAPAAPVRLPLADGQSLEMVRVARGTFSIGSPRAEASRGADEVKHEVTLTEDFLIGAREVTVGQFRAFANETGYRTEAETGASGGQGVDGHGGMVQRPGFNWKNPGYAATDQHPVTIVTFADAMAFAEWATTKTGHVVTLPTEAQWEVAARGGSDQPYAGQRDSNGAQAIGWTKQNAGGVAHPVGGRPPNALGLYDTVGNAGEWCRDFFGPYPGGAETNPMLDVAPAGDKARRVVRGGSFLRDVVNARSAARYRSAPGSRDADIGFRVVASVAGGASNAPHRAASKGTNGDAAIGLIILFVALLVFGAFVSIIGFVAWLLMKTVLRGHAPPSANDVKLRTAPDGVWILAPVGAAGAKLKFRAETAVGPRTGEIVLNGANAQFVYTGTPVTAAAVLALEAAPRGTKAAGRRSAGTYRGGGYRGGHAGYNDDWNDPMHHHHDASAQHGFVGFPSAY